MSDQERITKVLTVADEKTVPSYANPPPNSTAENSLRQTAHPGDRTTKGSIRGGNDPGHGAEGSCLTTGAAESAIGSMVRPRPRRASSRPPKIGRSGNDAAGKNRKHFVYGKLHCKEKHSRPAVPLREKSLAIRFDRSIQSSDDSQSVYCIQLVEVLDIV